MIAGPSATAETSTDRRHFVRACIGLATMPVLAACASLAAVRVPVSGGRARLALASHPELSRPGGALKILPDGASAPVLVVARDDGTFLALSTVCTHRGCEVELSGARVVCPCHGSTYDRSGKVLRGPAERSLSSVDVRLAEGILEIDLEALR